MLPLWPVSVGLGMPTHGARIVGKNISMALLFPASYRESSSSMAAHERFASSLEAGLDLREGCSKTAG